MDATATPRGISLAVGELGAHGRPTFYMTSRTAVSVNRIRSLRPSTVFVDVCPRDTHTLPTRPVLLRVEPQSSTGSCYPWSGRFLSRYPRRDMAGYGGIWRDMVGYGGIPGDTRGYDRPSLA